MKTYTQVRNLQWANGDNTLIDMEVNFDHEPEEWVPFTADLNDTEEHGPELYNRAVAGDFGTIAEWVAPGDFSSEESLSELREQRTALLAATDYIEMPTKWATLTSEQQTAWATYRNALRDLPSDYPNAILGWDSTENEDTWRNVTWPTKPTI